MFCPLLLPPATKLWQGNILTGVCDSVHRGVCLSACWDTTPQGPGRPPRGPGTPPDQAPPWTNPPDQAPPRTRYSKDQAPSPQKQSILGDMVNKWVVCILLECNLVFITQLRQGNIFTPVCDSVHRGVWQTPPPHQADGTHPTAMHSCYIIVSKSHATMKTFIHSVNFLEEIMN